MALFGIAPGIVLRNSWCVDDHSWRSLKYRMTFFLEDLPPPQKKNPFNHCSRVPCSIQPQNDHRFGLICISSWLLSTIVLCYAYYTVLHLNRHILLLKIIQRGIWVIFLRYLPCHSNSFTCPFAKFSFASMPQTPASKPESEAERVCTSSSCQR